MRYIRRHSIMSWHRAHTPSLGRAAMAFVRRELGLCLNANEFWCAGGPDWGAAPTRGMAGAGGVRRGGGTHQRGWVEHPHVAGKVRE